MEADSSLRGGESESTFGTSSLVVALPKVIRQIRNRSAKIAIDLKGKQRMEQGN
jgi:hypothetical protein